MADLDLGGRLGEAVAAILAFAALHEAGIAQFAQDRVEEFLRDVVGGGDVADESQLAGRQLRQMHEGLEAVFAFFSQHCLNASSTSAASRSELHRAKDDDSSPSHSGFHQR